MEQPRKLQPEVVAGIQAKTTIPTKEEATRTLLVSIDLKVGVIKTKLA